jgi:methionyl-tRNA synthetase
VQHVEEENYFFRLSRFEQRLIDWYSLHPSAVVPEHRVNEVLGFIKQ